MLKDELKTLLGTTFTFYVKIHGFHFNLEGDNFPQYHEFLNKFYADVYDQIDSIGEFIRTLDSYAPGSVARYQQLTILQDQDLIPRSNLMMQELYTDNEKYTLLLKKMFHTAESEDEQAIANYIAERIAAHQKWGWQLRSTLNRSRE